jgi:hypothetical protein
VVPALGFEPVAPPSEPSLLTASYSLCVANEFASSNKAWCNDAYCTRTSHQRWTTREMNNPNTSAMITPMEARLPKYAVPKIALKCCWCWYAIPKPEVA